MHTRTLAAASATDQTVLSVANSPVLWACAVGVFLIIIIQSVIYMKAARTAAPEAGMTTADLKTAFRVGAVSAIGPSLAVVLVAIALLSLFGGPAVLVRIGLVGSAGYETGAASIAASTVGAHLGDETYTADIFALVFAAMSLGGICWMLSTLVLTPLLKRGDQKMRALNPLLMTIIPTAAMIAAFVVLGFETFTRNPNNIAAFGISGGIMLTLLLISKVFNIAWIKEWSLGITLLASFTVLFVLF